MNFRSFVVIFGFCFTLACGPFKKLPIYDSIPAFTATDSRNHPFTRADMTGHVWIVDFIYTTCPAECPLMSNRMAQLRKQIDPGADIRFLSISVDPEHDTPPVLAEFAGRYRGGDDRWIFLAADAATVHKLAFETFHVGDVLGKIQHSSKFALVDKHGRIRGYYSSLGGDDLATLRTDAGILNNE